MKTIKQILSVGFILILHLGVYAQYVVDTNTVETQLKKVVEPKQEQIKLYLSDYFEKLDLTDQQKISFIEITKKYGSQLKDLKDSDASGLSKYKTYKKIKKNRASEMKSILNESQFKIYEQVQKEVEKKIKEERKKKSS